MTVSQLRRIASSPSLWARGGSGATSKRAIVAALLVLATFALGGLLQLRMDTTMRSFLPSGDPAYQALEERARSFGDDPIVVLAQTKQPQDIGRNEDVLLGFLRLEGALSRLDNVASVYGPGTMLNQIAKSAQDFLAEISGRRDALEQAARIRAQSAGASASEVQRAGQLAVDGFDQRYGSLLVGALPAGLPTLSNEAFVTSVLYDNNQDVRPQWKFVVPSDHAVAVLVRPQADLDQEQTSRLVADVRSAVGAAHLDVRSTTVTGVPVVTAALSGRAQHEFPIIGSVAVAAVGFIFFMAPWERRRRRRIIPLLAAVGGSAITVGLFGWLGRPLSLGVVAFMPILMGIGSDFPYYMLTHGIGRRVVVAATAAAAGFAALVLSPLPFVRELGVALGVGVLATLGVALMLRRLAGSTEPALSTDDAAGPSIKASRRTMATTAVVGAVVAGFGWVSLSHLAIEGRPDRLASGISELSDARNVESILGSDGEIGVMLTGHDALSPRALSWSKQADNGIITEHGNELRSVVSPPELFAFLGDHPTPEQVSAGLDLMPQYLTSAVVRSDRTASLMTFGVGFDDLNRQRSLITDVQKSLPATPPGLQSTVVGLPVVVARGIDLISSGRLLMNLVGLLVACLVVGLGLGRGAALRVLVTGLLATGWVLTLVVVAFGSLNPLTIAVGSLITATSCEFSVMLERGRGLRCNWKVIATAGMAGVVGYLALSISELALLRTFGLLLAAGVLFSFLSAVLVHSLSWRLSASTSAVEQRREAAIEGVLV